MAYNEIVYAQNSTYGCTIHKITIIIARLSHDDCVSIV